MHVQISALPGLILTILIFVFHAECVWAQAIVVPAQHPVYDWLKSQRILGKIPDYEHERLPHHRTQVNRWLRSVLENPGTTRHDRMLASDFLGEFDVSFTRTYVRNLNRKKPVEAALEIVNRRPEPFIAGGITDDKALSGAFYLQRSWGSLVRIGKGQDGYVMTPGYGVKLFAGFENRWGLFFQADNPSFFGDSISLIRFVPQWNSTYTYQQGGANSYKYETYVGYNSKYLTVTLGRGALSHGASLTEPVVIRPDVPWFSWLQTNVGTSRVHFYNLYANLHAESAFSTQTYAGTTITVRNRPPRRLQVHGLRVRPSAWMSFSIFETLIYSREFDLDYVNPMIPYVFSEQDKGDMDDKKLGAEIVLRPIKRVEFFGSLLVDDLPGLQKIVQLDSTKMIFTVGAVAMLPYNIQSGFSYTRSDANMYTHYMRLNTYENKGQSIGFGLGPNAEEYAIQISRWFSYRTRIRLSASIQRKGLNPLGADGTVIDNVGGELLNGVGSLSQKLYEGADVQEWIIREAELQTEPVRGFFFSYRWTLQDIRKGTRVAPVSFSRLVLRVGF
jgi:hypothetical protein